MDCTYNQEDDLIVDCVPETQNIDRSISQSIDVIFILTSMLEGWVDHFSSTSTISNLCAREGCSPLAKKGRSTSILKHIGMLEDELEVFVDSLDDNFVPTSNTNTNTESPPLKKIHCIQLLEAMFVGKHSCWKKEPVE
jgi:hypothetical protein